MIRFGSLNGVAPSATFSAPLVAVGWFLRKILGGFLGNILASHATFPSAIHQPFGMPTPVVATRSFWPGPQHRAVERNSAGKFARRFSELPSSVLELLHRGKLPEALPRCRTCPCTNRRPCARPCNFPGRLQFPRGIPVRNSGAPANESIDPNECGACRAPPWTVLTTLTCTGGMVCSFGGN
jgi:hypothetical protein